MLEPDAGKYFFVNQGKLTIDKVDDAQEMRDTKKAFDILLFTQVNSNNNSFIKLKYNILYLIFLKATTIGFVQMHSGRCHMGQQQMEAATKRRTS